MLENTKSMDTMDTKRYTLTPARVKAVSMLVSMLIFMDTHGYIMDTFHGYLRR